LRSLGGNSGVEAVAFSPDGRLLATSGDSQKKVGVWDADTGELLRVLAGSDCDKDVAFSPDGRLLACCGWENTVELWDPVTFKHLGTLTGHKGGIFGTVHGVAFSPDGRLLASCGSDKTVRLWSSPRPVAADREP